MARITDAAGTLKDNYALVFIALVVVLSLPAMTFSFSGATYTSGIVAAASGTTGGYWATAGSTVIYYESDGDEAYQYNGYSNGPLMLDVGSSGDAIVVSRNNNEDTRRLNTSTCTVAWNTSDTTGSQEYLEVRDGVAYITSNAAGDEGVQAVYVSNGTTKWRYVSQFGSPHHGVAVGDDRVWSGTAGGSIIVLNKSTGAYLDHTGTGESSTVSGMEYYDGYVYVGQDNGDLEQWTNLTFSGWSNSYSEDVAAIETADTQLIVSAGNVTQVDPYDGSDTVLSTIDASWRLDVSNSSKTYYTVNTSDAGLYALDSFGSVISTNTNKTFNDVSGYADALHSYEISGTVTDQNGNPVEDATVRAVFNNSVVANDTTDPNGDYSFEVFEGSYTLEARKNTYDNESRDMFVNQPRTEDFELTGPVLTIEVKSFIRQGDTHPYRILFEPVNGSARDVSDSAVVSSTNTSVLVVDQLGNNVTGGFVNASANITAEYNNTIARKEIVVATLDFENVKLLPGAARISASMGDQTWFAILIATLVGLVGARVGTAFAGISFMAIATVVAWGAGYMPLGIVLVSVFYAVFIGLNLAGNIDYSVRQG